MIKAEESPKELLHITMKKTENNLSMNTWFQKNLHQEPVPGIMEKFRLNLWSMPWR